MQKRNIAIVLAALVVLVLIGVFLRGGKQTGTSVITATVTRGPFSVKLAENGVVVSPRSESIPSLVSGNLQTLDVQEGEHVVAGQLLATVYNPTLYYQAAGSQADYRSSVADVATARVNEQNARVQYQAQLQTAKSNLDLAQQIYNEDVSLFASQAIPRNQLDTDRAKLEQARVSYEQALNQLRLGAVTGYGVDSVQYAQDNARKAAITNAQNQQQLGFTRIVAPFDGIILSVAADANDPLRTIRIGAPITQGQELFTIASNDRYVVRAEVDEQDIINVRVGQRVVITGEDFPGKTITGHVALIAPIATKSSDASSTAKQVLTTIRLDTSPSYLKDGMNADVDILTTDLARALTVPNAAVVTQNGASYVFVVSHGTAHKRRVTLGAVGDTSTVVLAGLRPGEVVVSQQYPGLSDGASVEPTTSPSPLPLPT
jgi:RND family efflux transporter MFP subunit